MVLISIELLHVLLSLNLVPRASHLTERDLGNEVDLVFVSIKKEHQTLKTVFHRLSKHLGFHQNTPLCIVFSTLFSVFRHVVKLGLLCLSHYLFRGLCQVISAHS